MQCIPPRTNQICIYEIFKNKQKISVHICFILLHRFYLSCKPHIFAIIMRIIRCVWKYHRKSKDAIFRLFVSYFHRNQLKSRGSIRKSQFSKSWFPAQKCINICTKCCNWWVHFKCDIRCLEHYARILFFY